MKFVVADWETFFCSKTGYTLKKMSTESYIRDPRFDPHGCAIKWGPDYAARWYDARQIKQILKDEGWSDVCMIHHHGQFDSFIESHHYGVRPKMIACTLAMARHMIGNHISVSLDSVRKHFGLPAKTTPYGAFDGKHWNELAPQTQEQIAEGACDEVESIWTIFGKLLQQGFPREELEIVDKTVRMFSEPVLRGDIDLLGTVWENERARKQQALENLDVTPEDLQSAAKFQALLEEAGVEIEYKEGKNGPIPAFAKNDEFMQALLEDDDEYVRTLAEARVGQKSNLLQTRAETLGWMARRGPLCVYLRYCGAHTSRWSGGDGANWQNFKRIDKKSNEPTLRDAILPPEGYRLIEPDLSQIEARVLACLAGQEDSLEEFRRGEDPYLKLASLAYGFEVTADMPKERGTGKQLRLSCGFQAGAKTIQRTARLGIYGPPVVIDLDTALRWRDIYREANPRVVDYWGTAGRMIARIAGGDPTTWGPFTIRGKKVFLPNGLRINYDTLEYHADPDTREGNWRVRKRNGWTKLYSGKLVENLVQFAARCVASQAFIRISRLGYRIVNTEHDKHWVLIPLDGKEKQHIEAVQREMVRDVPWMPGLPLACQIS